MDIDKIIDKMGDVIAYEVWGVTIGTIISVLTGKDTAMLVMSAALTATVLTTFIGIIIAGCIEANDRS